MLSLLLPPTWRLNPPPSFLGHYEKCRRGDPPNPGACACLRGGKDVRSAPSLCRGCAAGLVWPLSAHALRDCETAGPTSARETSAWPAPNGGRSAAQQAGHWAHCACIVLALVPIRRALRGDQDACGGGGWKQSEFRIAGAAVAGTAQRGPAHARVRAMSPTGLLSMRVALP